MTDVSYLPATAPPPKAGPHGLPPSAAGSAATRSAAGETRANAAPAATTPTLEDPTGGRRSRGTRLSAPGWIRRLTGPAVLFAVWWAVTGTGLVGGRVLASPLAVARAFGDLAGDGELWNNLSVSLVRVGWGVLFGVAAGLVLAVLAGFFRAGEHIVDSSMNFLRTIPIIALLPLIIVWIGIGESAKIFLISAGVVFPVYMNTFAGIRGVDVKLVEAGRTFGLGRLGLIRRVIIPGALPGFLIGLRWSLGVAWLLLVFAEQVNTDRGIGYLLTSAQGWNRTDIIILCLVIYGLLGLLCDGIVRVLEGSLLSWRRGFSGT
ncbi:ABC transporter permease [Pseudofrankia sp. BMG5.36]|uniref:ABC transporter permease n=1 Tax=Pseudofrankia sp. BMG5.36 TaxID=1834512 RepID=UPI0008DA46A9|nr:ABC transporter permease [Pseudofrankia sp. BMG5.36]OHV73645.1 ABC transporter permease [Pseudofrankia sp. BMG5.36]